MDNKKYIGTRVYAGEMNGGYGKIVDVIPDEDDPKQTWFIVEMEEDKTLEKWDKSDLKRVMITAQLRPL